MINSIGLFVNVTHTKKVIKGKGKCSPSLSSPGLHSAVHTANPSKLLLECQVEVEAAQSDQGAWMVNVPPGISLDGPGVMKILMNCKL